MEAAQLDPDSPLGGDPRTASTLSVWETPQALWDFTFRTLHKRFYEKRDAWYDAAAQGWGGHRLVMWWVAEGRRPDIPEAAARLAHLMEHGPTDDAFGWDHLRHGLV